LSIAKSPRSYNSQIGVPLSVWRLNAHHQLGIFEAGISQTGEMAKLQQVIKPTIGVLTNVGSAHAAGFRSFEQKIAEKLLLFESSDVLIYCRDHDAIHKALSGLPLTRSLSWSLQGSGDINADVRKGPTTCDVTATYEGRSVEFKLPFTDDISIENAMHCLAVMIELKVDLESHLPRFMQLRNLPLRLELKKASGGSTLIYDCYNADLDSLALALDFMVQHDTTGHRTVILSDLLQSGLDQKELYESVATLLRNRRVTQLIGIGKHIGEASGCFNDLVTTFYSTTDDFIRNHSPRSLAFHTILLKGARHFQFERIGHYLERQVHRTVLEIDLNALAHNLSVYRGFLPDEVKVMVMVKALSYGAGSYEIAQLMQFHQVDYLAVAYTDEGIELRQSGIRLPIMVMNPSSSDVNLLIEHNLEPEIYQLDLLVSYLEAIGQRSPAPPIHLKLETGMHRLGFSEKEIDDALDMLTRKADVRVASVLSHLAASDDPKHDHFTQQQFQVFDRMAGKVARALGYTPMKHILNSSGIVRFRDRQYDMVRLGIGLYGVDMSGQVGATLRPISTLRTVVSQVKELSPGDVVGYNVGFTASRPMRVATIGIGYADGYRRSLGNGKGFVMIRGHRVPTVGNVCMDMTMVDVTSVKECKAGEEVEVFGHSIPVEEVAQWAGTSAYEIISTISSRVKRVYLEE
jgi:alanine racemase